jgi:D-sedoheptulose 7-phosphate isomerase
MPKQRVHNYIARLQETMQQLDKQSIVDVISVLQYARMRGNQIFIMGNGGSATTASHFVCDLAKGTKREGLPRFRVIGLADNMAIFSAYANDEGYETVFAEQLANLIRPGDVVIGISASGKSPNVINAMQESEKHRDVTKIGFTGFDGGRLKQMSHFNIHVDSNIIEHVEDIHLMLEHIIIKTIRELDELGQHVTTPIPELITHYMGD